MAISHDGGKDLHVQVHNLSEYWCLGGKSGGELPTLISSVWEHLSGGPLRVQYVGFDGPLAYPARLSLRTHCI